MSATDLEQLHEQLSIPAVSLQLYGRVLDQKTKKEQQYNPHRITRLMQETIISHISYPPRDRHGKIKWLTILGSRQTGKSTTAACAFLPKVMYKPGWLHVCIADKVSRADELHTRVMYMYEKWAPELRTEQRSDKEYRALNLKNHSRMQILSAHADYVGIGLSCSSLHASECAFWRDAAGEFAFIHPTMFNVDDSIIVKECTPAPMSAPSAQWWKDECEDSRKGLGRRVYAFFPFWDSALNRRDWLPGDELSSEERKLMDQYEPLGMEKENIAFMRDVMDNDSEIRRNPELFFVFYPPDDTRCWIGSAGGVIPSGATDRHMFGLVEEPEGYREFRPPDPDATYVMGVDPAAWGGRDHASFQILEVWDDGWDQVASFGAVVDPNDFADLLEMHGRRYNNALIGVERNGVGTGAIMSLRRSKYPNLYWQNDRQGSRKPGVHKSSHEDFVSILVDALMDKLTIRGRETLMQIRGYNSDKLLEKTPRAELISPSKGIRRGRHHWDRCSAMMVACAIAPYAPRRLRSKSQPKVITYQGLTERELNELIRKMKADREQGGYDRRYIPIRERG